MKLPTVYLFTLLLFVLPAWAQTSVFFSPHGGCEDQARSLVDSAKKTLEIAVYSLNSPTIVSAIEAAAHRGVKINVLTDRTQAFGKGNLDATKRLAALTQDFRVHSWGRIMHNKFAVADEREVMLGSFNWTRTAENANDENCLITDDPNIVQAYKNRFETHLWTVNTSEKSNSTLLSKGISIHKAKEKKENVTE
jgi:phosphatidylserine/phosphatidylglycerophosphate/cardiolipin synthase-like enzyme